MKEKLWVICKEELGPNKYLIYGILQPILDGIKLILKEPFILSESSKYLYIISPIIAIFLSLIIYFIIPIKDLININFDKYNILLILGILSLNIYSTLFSGWS